MHHTEGVPDLGHLCPGEEHSLNRYRGNAEVD
jgi:hypothetical protein